MKISVDIDSEWLEVFDDGSFAVRTPYIQNVIDAVSNGEVIKTEQKYKEFAEFVAREVVDEEMWEYNYNSFAELACRKLNKLGLIKSDGNCWVLKE